jgi:hypothetical protein
MGTLSMTASDLHTKYHWPPDRSSDLLGDEALGSTTIPFDASTSSTAY